MQTPMTEWQQVQVGGAVEYGTLLDGLTQEKMKWEVLEAKDYAGGKQRALICEVRFLGALIGVYKVTVLPDGTSMRRL